MPGPSDLLAQIQARQTAAVNAAAPSVGSTTGGGDAPNPLAAMLKARNNTAVATAAVAAAAAPSKSKPTTSSSDTPFRTDRDKPFSFDSTLRAFLFFAPGETANSFVPKLESDAYGNADTNILVPLAPCIYRLTDYTLAKREPVTLQRCILKLGVLRCLKRECQAMNHLLQHRNYHETLEEEELGKIRFMELLSNCGVYQKVSELILKRAGQVLDLIQKDKNAKHTDSRDSKNPYRIPQVSVDGLEEFLQEIEKHFPELQQARKEIEDTQTVSFYPGLGELFCPGSKLVFHPEGMEGSPLGCSCVQSWYAEELNKATNKVKRRFILVIEFIVSVGDELVFVAATDVYPEFHDLTRNAFIKDLVHRKLTNSPDDLALLERLQQRGEFYASVATKNHYLEYHPDSFFPIIGGGWNSNAVRPLPKGGRVMVDVKRGILEGHIPVRGSSSNSLSDTVKEAIKLFEQSKRTGVAVPFRTAILPGFVDNNSEHREDSDRPQLWQSWPMLSGFSFTSRVWGKLLLGMPKPKSATLERRQDLDRRPSTKRMGVERAALGGEGSCSNCGYIRFQEQAFEQLVLAEDKKELIRAVARNAGGGSKYEDDSTEDDEDDDTEEIGIDVVANKGGASIFLLHGPPGCGKTLTAEAIAELLRKPLYIVTAGDLGVTAADVERTLGSVLDLCQTWDALVLIDEADIFLEARNSTEIQRNALVCVMLRLLEYYSGCLFLSSNRAAGSIDAAIASRITVMLGYPALDAKVSQCSMSITLRFGIY